MPYFIIQNKLFTFLFFATCSDAEFQHLALKKSFTDSTPSLGKFDFKMLYIKTALSLIF
jgi:hypothetical protein